MNVSILDREKIKKSINKNSKDLIGMGKQLTLLGFSSNRAIVTKNGIQSAIFSKSGDKVFDKIIKPAILLDCIDAESSIPGSGDISLEITSRLISSLYSKIGSGVEYKDYEKISNNLLSFCIEEIRRIGYHPTRRDFQKLVNQEIKDPFIRKIIKTCVDLSAARREISCQISNSFDTVARIEQGYKFSIRPCEGFVSGKWKRNNVGIITIDGAIIEISEIHHLLEKCSEKEIPAIIFCRNFSPDVLNTLYVNKKRGTLDIIPVEISIENETLNMLKDICVVSGTSLISSEMGDLISSSIRKELIQVESVEISENYIKIFNKLTQSDCQTHLSFLKRKRKESVQEAQVYIDNRIKSMTCESVSILVGQSQLHKNKASMEKIDSFLRYLSIFFKTGCMDILEFEKSLLDRKKSAQSLEKFHIDSIISSIKQSNKKIASVGSVIKALRTSISTSNSIFSTAIILADDS